MVELTKYEDFIFDKISKTHLPGLSLAVIIDGKVHLRSFGYRDIEQGLKATPETLYGIGSVTKSFTALSVMKLAGEGKLKLEDPLNKYLDINLDNSTEPIRIWHLLSHSSGIPALAYAEALIRFTTGAGDRWVPIASPEDMINFMQEANRWVYSKPGDRWFYLNEGYVLLGKIIEQVSGISYEKYVKENILIPLQMTRSFFRKEEVEKDNNVAVPYIITREGKAIKSSFPYGITSDGGLISNVLDLANYLLMYINRGHLFNKEILSAELIYEMEKPRVKLPLQVFKEEGYGYGLSINPNFMGNKMIGHGGSVLVYTAYIAYIPEKKVGIAILANGAGYPLFQIGQFGLALLTGNDPASIPYIKMENVFDQLSGSYETYKETMNAQVVAGNGILQLVIKDKYRDLTVPLVPEDIEGRVKVFFVPQAGAKLPVEFIIEDDKVHLIYERYRMVKVGKLPK